MPSPARDLARFGGGAVLSQGAYFDQPYRIGYTWPADPLDH